MCFPWFPGLISSNNVRYVTLTTMGNLITKNSGTMQAFQTDAASALLRQKWIQCSVKPFLPSFLQETLAQRRDKLNSAMFFPGNDLKLTIPL